MVVKGLIFDLDGTLLVHKLRLREAKEKFLERLKQLNLPSLQASIDTPIAYILNKLDDERRDIVFNILDEVYEPFEMESAEEAELREYVREVLEFLKNSGIRLGIATNNGRKSVELILKKKSLMEFFDTVVTRNDIRDLKPNSMMIMETVKRLDVRLSEAVHVGDTTYDVLAAHQIGVKCIAITGGAHGREELLSSNPEFIVDSIKEIPLIIMKM
ncbi:MAG: HAD family hydrolase [Candidatus Caldarchaeales archaeon]